MVGKRLGRQEVEPRVSNLWSLCNSFGIDMFMAQDHNMFLLIMCSGRIEHRTMACIP